MVSVTPQKHMTLLIQPPCINIEQLASTRTPGMRSEHLLALWPLSALIDTVIMSTIDVQEEHRVILAQRFAEGGDLLRALHKAGGRLTEKSAVQMVIHPLLNCLVYLHSKGITHR